MAENIKIRKGADIKLVGAADKIYADYTTKTVVVKPTDFHGLTPKLDVKVGDKVQKGSPLFHDKYNENLLFTSPAAGEVVDVKRGEKRKILEIKVAVDANGTAMDFGTHDTSKITREEALKLLLNSGLFPVFKQRPYDVIADPTDIPKMIIVKGFDSAPLAPDYDFIVHGQKEEFQHGLNVISKLTSGKVHLNVNGAANVDDAFTSAKNVQLNRFSGPHPAGLAGVQIHKLDPINKGERVWVIGLQEVIAIGKLAATGHLDSTRIVAVAGSEVAKPRYARVTLGGEVSGLLDGNLQGEKPKRVISGNVLTGTKIDDNGHLGYYDYLVSVIIEDEEPEFFGWILPKADRFSLSRALPAFLMPNKKYTMGTSLHGEDRAFVMTGEYEKVFPFDIYPQQLLKACMIGDIELMENLGIYEVAPEDFALCEFACTSKIECQTILREALDVANKELG